MDTRELHPDKEKSDRQPYRVRMPGFIREEVGLGEAIKRVTHAVGIKHCGACERRAGALNRWIVLTR